MSEPVSAADGPTPRERDLTSPQLPSHPRIEVLRGGPLSVEETAALTVAVAAHVATAARPEAGSHDHAWARATRLEGTGHTRIERPSDLDRAARGR